MQRAAGYLACAGRVAVDEHHHRHQRVDGFHAGAVFAVGALELALRLHERDVFGYEHIEYVDSLLQRAAAVAAQVEHKRLHALAVHLEIGAAHVFRASFGEGAQQQVAYAVVLQAVIGHGRHLYGAARHLQAQRLALDFAIVGGGVGKERLSGALHLQHKSAARVTAQV